MADPFIRPGQPHSHHTAHLIHKVSGTGHPDTTAQELACQHQRDQLSHLLLFLPSTMYIATSTNTNTERVRCQLLERLHEPYFATEEEPVFRVSEAFSQ